VRDFGHACRDQVRGEVGGNVAQMIARGRLQVDARVITALRVVPFRKLIPYVSPAAFRRRGAFLLLHSVRFTVKQTSLLAVVLWFALRGQRPSWKRALR
jgi:hypothetical protein